MVRTLLRNDANKSNAYLQFFHCFMYAYASFLTCVSLGQGRHVL
jgi:hypothetical protein